MTQILTKKKGSKIEKIRQKFLLKKLFRFSAWQVEQLETNPRRQQAKSNIINQTKTAGQIKC